MGKRIRYGVLLAVVMTAAAVVARDPLYWKRYLLSGALLAADPPPALYEPRERVVGIEGAQQPHVAPEEEHIDPEALRAAADYAASRNSQALIVSRHGHVAFERYWNDTGFDTRAFTGGFERAIAALMVGVALDDRKISSLDEPAANYLQEWRDDERRTITIRHLLEMASGLQPSKPAHHPWAPRVREQLGTDIVREYLQRPLVAPPGSLRLPQSADPQWLAVIVERASGVRYAEYVSRMLWKPLAAGDAFVWLDRSGGMAHADRGLLARQSDWMRIAQVLLSDGLYQGERIVPPGFVREILEPAKTSTAESYARRDVWILEGTGRNRLWLVPSLSLAILRIGTEPDESSDWDDTRIPDLIIRGLQDLGAMPQSDGVDLSKLVPNH